MSGRRGRPAGTRKSRSLTGRRESAERRNRSSQRSTPAATAAHSPGLASRRRGPATDLDCPVDAGRHRLSLSPAVVAPLHPEPSTSRGGRPCNPGNERLPDESELDYRRRRDANNRRSARERRRQQQQQQQQHPGLGPTSLHPRNDLGQMDRICSHCGARHFHHERQRAGNNANFAGCCSSGKVRLDLPRIHPLLQRLMTKEDGLYEEARFVENIRSYNEALSFMSVGGSCRQMEGPSNLRVIGTMRHRLSAIHPRPDREPAYAQLYAADAERAHQLRMEFWGGRLHDQLLRELERAMAETNPYAVAYHHLAAATEAAEAAEVDADVRICFPAPATRNNVRVRQPAADNDHDAANDDDDDDDDDIPAVVYTHRNDTDEDDIIFPPRIDGDRQHQILYAPYTVRPPLRSDYPGVVVSTNSHIWVPMTYPFLRPFGEFGWSPGILYREATTTTTTTTERQEHQRQRQTVTIADYARYHLQDRGFFNPILSAGRLFQQWCCDIFLASLNGKLDHVRANQHHFRRRTYGGLEDVIGDGGEDRAAAARVYLPSSVTGSPRWYALQYQDSMALVRSMGKPDLIVTFTCNPGWPKVERSKEPFQRTDERNDLICRVFRGKLEVFLAEIVERRCFGDWTWYAWSLEFQKVGGLPHVHLVLALAEHSKPTTAEEIDRIISAELPDPLVDGELHDTVTRCMLHRCGEPAGGRGRHCMLDGVCTECYPRAFCNETRRRIGDGYPEYKRRPGQTCVVRGHVYDNRWVVPYNPYLVKVLDAHVNVQLVTTVGVMSYIFKYPGGEEGAEHDDDDDDDDDDDEIYAFQSRKTTTSMEAIWRLLDMPLHGKSHPVQQLHVHLENDDGHVTGQI